jgi:hypothetical protein
MWIAIFFYFRLMETSPPLLRTLLATFNLPLRPRDVNRWRGAFVEVVGREEDWLHNHQGDQGLHYRYPLVQYRARHGRAAIMALNQGATALHQALQGIDWHICWRGQPQELRLETLQLREHQLGWREAPQRYRLHRWVALNGKAYQHWIAAPDLSARLHLLERTLARQIQAFAHSVGWEMPEPPPVQLLDLRLKSPARVHGAPLMAFDLDYQTPLCFPPLIALGKATSLGYGWQIPLGPRP